MKILLYGINYAPELTGIGKYNGEMGDWFVKAGHEVQVVTAFPYYPNWKIQAPYQGNWWKKERPQAGLTITRCPLYVPKRPGALRRIVHEFSFLLSSCLALVLSLFQKIDVVVCVVTPFHLGIPARLFSWIKGVPMVYHVQDLQVDAAADLGMIKNKRLLAWMITMERWILQQADLVTTISSGMIKKIRAKGISAQKIYFFPNWVDTDFIYPLPKEQSLKSELGFQSADRIVLYAGNLGEKQGLEMLIELARELRGEDLHFAIVGEGGARARLEHLAQTYQLSNVHFFPLQPYEQLPALLAMADLHLVLQKRAAADLVMPSKLTTILAAGGCPLVTAEEGSTLYETVKTHGLGVLVQPEDLNALRMGILTALQKDTGRYQQNARAYADQYLQRESILNGFEEQLKIRCKSSAKKKKKATFLP